MNDGGPLIGAARKGDVSAVMAHLKEAARRDTRGWTALMHASARNFVECVKALIPYERGLADPQKITALMIAADNGHTEVVRLLAKEEPRLQNSDGWTALMHASYRGFDECAELLLDEAGMQTTRRKDGMAPGSTALMVAARFSRPECVELLRDREKGFVDSEGHDALWYAENKGVNPNVKTSEVYRDPRVLKLLEGTRDVHSDGGMGGVESGPAQTNIEADPIDPVPILPPQCQDDRNDSIPARPNEPRKQGRDAPVDDSRLRMLQETLSKKNQEIDQLKAVNTSLRADIDERDEYIRILEDTLRENEKRHNELTDEFSALKEGSTALEDHIGQLQQRLANTEEDRRLARNEASEARARAEQLQRENAERQNVLDATKRELENSRRQLRETGEERSRVVTQLSQSEECCRGLIDEVPGLQKQVEEGKNEQKKNAALIDSLKVQLTKTKEEKNSLHKQFEDKERRDRTQIDQLTAEVESLKKDLSSSKNAHNETKNELSQSNREVSSLKQQLDNAIEESKRHARMCEDLQKTSHQKQALIEELTAKNTFLQDQLAMSKKTHEEIGEKLSQMKRENSSLKHRFDEAIEESKRHAELQKASDQKQALIDELTIEKTTLQERLASSKNTQEGTGGNVSQMNQEINLLKQKLQKANEEAEKNHELNEALNKRAQEAEKSLTEAREENASLKNQLTKIKEEKDALYKDFEDKERNDKACIDQLSAEVKSLGKELASSKSTYEEKEGKVSQLLLEIDILKQQLDSTIDESKRYDDLQKLSDQKQALVAYLEKENANRQARIDELIAEKTSLQEQLTSSKNALEETKQELFQTKQEVISLREQLSRITEESASLHRQLEDEKRKNTGLESSLLDLKRANTKVESICEERCVQDQARGMPPDSEQMSIQIDKEEGQKLPETHHINDQQPQSPPLSATMVCDAPISLSKELDDLRNNLQRLESVNWELYLSDVPVQSGVEMRVSCQQPNGGTSLSSTHEALTKFSDTFKKVASSSRPLQTSIKKFGKALKKKKAAQIPSVFRDMRQSTEKLLTSLNALQIHTGNLNTVVAGVSTR
ncbi:Ankyrin repeat protein 3 [Giardia muris]|uniref:Ankyrin repeat protein 3 n=1 Tax=Giardia muris TaxID=5742 RepID=A0A4Z1T0A3_GIAMU|nr:Ankyrin repeat protein 3 [Giardia muris]|eukprot:TNJ29128.1 Ankyrin repeat protein 3 [Giardia muris]